MWIHNKMLWRMSIVHRVQFVVDRSEQKIKIIANEAETWWSATHRTS